MQVLLLGPFNKKHKKTQERKIQIKFYAPGIPLPLHYLAFQLPSKNLFYSSYCRINRKPCFFTGKALIEHLITLYINNTFICRYLFHFLEPLALIFFSYSLGLILLYFLKHLLKYAASEYPDMLATSV